MGAIKNLGYFMTCSRCKEGYLIPWDWNDEFEKNTILHVCNDILKKEMDYERSQQDSSDGSGPGDSL